MRPTRRLVAGVGVAVLAVAAAYGAVFLYGQHEASVEIAEALATLPPGTTVHYDSSRYNPLTRTLAMHGLVATRNGAPMLSAREARLREITGDGSDAHPFRIGAVHLEQLAEAAGSRPATTADHVDIEDLQMLARLPDGAPPPGGIARFYQPAGAPRLVGFRRLEASGIAQPGRSIADARLNDLAPGHLGGISIDGIAGPTGKIGHLGAGNIALDDLDAVFDDDAYKDGKPAWTGRRRLIDHVELSDLTAISNGGLHLGSFALNGVVGQPFPRSPGTLPAGLPMLGLAAEALSIATLDAGNALLVYADGQKLALGSLHATVTTAGTAVTQRETLRGLALPLRELAESANRNIAIDALGTDTPVLDADFDTTADPAAKTLDFTAETFSLRSLGTLLLSMHLTGVDHALLQQSPLAGLAAASLTAGRLRYQDASLADRVMLLAAKARGVDIAQLRLDLHAQSAQIATLLPNQPDAAAVLDGFIDHPTTLTLTLAPPAPVNAASVMGTDPSARAALLGVRVSAN